jgi:hypothetical protein
VRRSWNFFSFGKSAQAGTDTLFRTYPWQVLWLEPRLDPYRPVLKRVLPPLTGSLPTQLSEVSGTWRGRVRVFALPDPAVTPREIRIITCSPSRPFKQGARLTLTMTGDDGQPQSLAVTRLAHDSSPGQGVAWCTDESPAFILSQRCHGLQLTIIQDQGQQVTGPLRVSTELLAEVPEIEFVTDPEGNLEQAAAESLRFRWRTDILPETFIVTLEPDARVFAHELRLPPVVLKARALRSRETPTGRIYSADVLQYLRMAPDAWKKVISIIARRHPSLAGFWIRVRVTATCGDGHWVQARSPVQRVMIPFRR